MLSSPTIEPVEGPKWCNSSTSRLTSYHSVLRQVLLLVLKCLTLSSIVNPCLSHILSCMQHAGTQWHPHVHDAVTVSTTVSDRQHTVFFLNGKYPFVEQCISPSISSLSHVKNVDILLTSKLEKTKHCKVVSSSSPPCISLRIRGWKFRDSVLAFGSDPRISLFSAAGYLLLLNETKNLCSASCLTAETSAAWAQFYRVGKIKFTQLDSSEDKKTQLLLHICGRLMRPGAFSVNLRQCHLPSSAILSGNRYF